MLDASPSHDIWDTLKAIFNAGGWMAVITTIVKTWLERRKPAAEVKQINADTDAKEATAEKTLAEGRSVEIENWLKLIKQIQSEMERSDLRHKTDCEDYERRLEKQSIYITALEGQLGLNKSR
jgi:hypothetical protein